VVKITHATEHDDKLGLSSESW